MPYSEDPGTGSHTEQLLDRSGLVHLVLRSSAMTFFMDRVMEESLSLVFKVTLIKQLVKQWLDHTDGEICFS